MLNLRLRGTQHALTQAVFGSLRYTGSWLKKLRQGRPSWSVGHLDYFVTCKLGGLSRMNLLELPQSQLKTPG
jgi:hypothetical protein